MTRAIAGANSEIVVIERRLADALRESNSVAEPEASPPLSEFSSGELLQMAWDRAEEELEELRTELRMLRQRHQSEERRVLARINEKRRLQRALIERAPKAASA